MNTDAFATLRNPNEITRFDFTRQARELMNEAVRMDVIDAVELAMIVVEHGKDTSAILDEISSAFWAARHWPASQIKSKAWHESRDDYKAAGLL